MRGRYLSSRSLGECLRPLTFVVAIGVLAAAPAARAQRVRDDSISALPVPDGPGDSTASPDHVRLPTEPPRFDPNSAAAARARKQQAQEAPVVKSTRSTNPAPGVEAPSSAAKTNPMESKPRSALDEPAAKTSGPALEQRVLDPWAEEPAPQPPGSTSGPAVSPGTGVGLRTTDSSRADGFVPARPEGLEPAKPIDAPSVTHEGDTPGRVEAQRAGASVPSREDRPLPMSEGLPDRPGDVERVEPAPADDGVVPQGSGDRPLPSSDNTGETPAPVPTPPQTAVPVEVEVPPATAADSYAPSQSSVPSPQPSTPNLSTPSPSAPEPSIGPDPGDRIGSTPPSPTP
jgi:hypothetical protein